MAPSGRVDWARGAPPLAALALTAAIWWQLRSGFYSWNDDLIQFKVALQYGWGTDLLTWNVFQHFAPINRTLHWFAITAFGLDPARSVWITTGLVLIFLLVVGWVAAELRLSPFRRTVAVVLVGGPMVLVNTLVWMDGGWHGITALIATYLVLALHLRAMRTGRDGWHVLSIVVFVLGLLTQERAAFALPLAVMADLFLVNQDRTWRARFRALTGAWWAFTAMAVASLVLAVVLRVYYVQPAAAGLPGAAVAGQTALAAFTNQLGPQLAGVVPELWPTAAQLAVLAVMVVIGVALRRLDRRNSGPLLFLVGAFILYWGFLVVSPNLTETNWADQATLHGIYTLVPVGLALASLRSGSNRAAPTARASAGSWTSLVIVALLLVGSQWRYTSSEAWAGFRAANDYLHSISTTAAIWTDPAITIVPTQAPSTVASDWAVPLGRSESLLRMSAPDWQPGHLTGTVLAFDDTGRLQRVDLQPITAAAPAQPPLYPDVTSTVGGASCLDVTATADGLRFRIEPPITGSPALIRLTYVSDRPGELTPITLAGVDPNWSSWSYRIQAGTHTILLPVDPGSLERVDGFQLARLPLDSTFCAESVQVVAPVILLSDGTCRLMDAWGRAGEVVECPTG